MRLGLLVLLVACGGTAHQTTIGPPPARQTHGALAGPLCTGDRCKCRTGDGDAGIPDDPKLKRFEIRMTSAQGLWASYRDSVLYKSPETAEQCFYVDLEPGNVPFELRASNPDGVSAQWKISELGAKTKSWYDTFVFNCGVPGVCSFDDLDREKQEHAAEKRQVRDVCGSVKAKSLTWDTGHAPDQLHPSELVVRVALDIYKRIPSKPHGDPGCGTGRGTTTEGEDLGVPDAPTPPPSSP